MCLGRSGNFNGEDIIDIIVRQEATPRYIARHLYNVFVADEVQVPAWNQQPPQDPLALEALAEADVDSDGSLRAMLRVRFNSNFFKNARFKRVKSPAELVASTVRMAGGHRFPQPGLHDLDTAAIAMGRN